VAHELFERGEVVSTAGEVTRSGLSMGAALAMVISWEHNHSVFWAIIHGILSWLYVFYYLLAHMKVGA